MKNLHQAVIQLLEAEEIRYRNTQHEGVVLADACGENGHYQVIIDVDEKAPSIQCTGLFPMRIPAPHCQAVLNLINEFNRKLRWGSFHIDCEDGELRFRTSIHLGETLPDQACIKHLILINLAMLDHHLPAIVAVATGQAQAKQVAEAVFSQAKQGAKVGSFQPPMCGRLGNLGHRNN